MLNINDRAFTYRNVYIYYMVVSVTLGFMHFAIVSVSDSVRQLKNAWNPGSQTPPCFIYMCVCLLLLIFRHIFFHHWIFITIHSEHFYKNKEQFNLETIIMSTQWDSYSWIALLASLRICWLYPLQRGKITQKKRCPGYDTKLHLVVRFQFWWYKFCEVLLHCHYSQENSDPERLYLLGIHLRVK